MFFYMWADRTGINSFVFITYKWKLLFHLHKGSPWNSRVQNCMGSLYRHFFLYLNFVWLLILRIELWIDCNNNKQTKTMCFSHLTWMHPRESSTGSYLSGASNQIYMWKDSSWLPHCVLPQYKNFLRLGNKQIKFHETWVCVCVSPRSLALV